MTHAMRTSNLTAMHRKNNPRTLDTHRQKNNFTLMVDDFGIKYRHKKDADHLISKLQAKYEATQDWTGGLYCEIKLKWNYKTRQLDISMLGYMKCALHKFQNPTPTIPQHSPNQWMAPKYESTATQQEHP